MAPPLFALRVRRKSDLIRAREKARRLAHLLHLGPRDEACVTAGAFAVGLQARAHYPHFDLCFQLDQRQLSIFVRPAKSQNLACPPIAEGDTKLLKLVKTIPEQPASFAAEDVIWMLGQIDRETDADLFAEVARQNQEILMLVHELQLTQREEGTNTVRNPSAA